MRKVFAILLFFSMSMCPLKAREVMVISTQSDFDKISETIALAVKKADSDIYITIAPGRYASGEESRTPGSGIVATNVNNVVMNNVVDGRIQFVGNETPENGCVFSNNYILLEEGERMPVHSIKNIKDEEKLIVLDHTGEKRGRIGLSLASYKALKKNPEWKRIKGFVIRKRR